MTFVLLKFFVILCINDTLALALHSRSRFFSFGAFQRSHCLAAAVHLRVGGIHQTGMYKHPKDDYPESISCKGLEIAQVHQNKIAIMFLTTVLKQVLSKRVKLCGGF